ncbi:hypothetical protein KVR01_011681 [Diaporthe batatas]|uniref:uncharacterized protein n=1 Tax=Diaporthe batatas TaxID=748121 RepID=UPI001D03DF1C|nr:uncharacterized protein KVR01_011681 [Diaporthe batatas]KAG8158559.1 hypothetical protein KVR01_011681 [Diaporthe batatas]
MFFSKSQFAALLLSASSATAKAVLDSRQAGVEDLGWGPICGLQPTRSEIISTTSTIYPGKMPQGQKGYLFAWIGIQGTSKSGQQEGDLVQSIVGSYPAGSSECSGPDADSTWCISSEVYGNDGSGNTIQFVGEKRTAGVNYENGIVFNYTLVDKSTYMWKQTMTDAVTGEVLATYKKTSGPMTLWNTAIEKQDANGNDPTGTNEPQYYVNTTIALAEADSSYADGIYGQNGATFTDMTTSDNGKTWFIEKITIPAMN